MPIQGFHSITARTWKFIVSYRDDGRSFEGTLGLNAKGKFSSTQKTRAAIVSFLTPTYLRLSFQLCCAEDHSPKRSAEPDSVSVVSYFKDCSLYFYSLSEIKINHF